MEAIKKQHTAGFKKQISKFPSLLEWGLRQIKDRYFNPGISFQTPKGSASSTSHIGHLMDCAIFRSLQQYDFCFCSCGLLHELDKYLANAPHLAEVIYPNYNRDYRLQERGEDLDDETPEHKATREAEEKECRRLLVEVFGPPTRITLTEIKEQYDNDKKLLTKVFKAEFPAGLLNLEQKLANDIAEYREYESYKSASSAS